MEIKVPELNNPVFQAKQHEKLRFFFNWKCTPKIYNTSTGQFINKLYGWLYHDLIHSFFHDTYISNTPQAAISAWSVTKEASAQDLQPRIDPDELHKGDSKCTGEKKKYH